MKLVIHIGMGKTGTSSIQAALDKSSDRLLAQGAEYLGMWFNMISPNFDGVSEKASFFKLPPVEMVQAADNLIKYLESRSEVHGGKTFVLSNEAISGQACAIHPMIARLVERGVEVRAIAYARNPLKWLPSAYVQWGIKHKLQPGSVRPYDIVARELVNWYVGLIEWHHLMGDILTVRYYDDASDIVVDFSEATGLNLALPHERVLERGEDVEILLRALYNRRFEEPVLPEVFDRAVLPAVADVPRLDHILQSCFNYADTAKIVLEKSDLFGQFTEAFGFDLLKSGKTYPPQPEIGALRDRLLDVLVEISLQQAQRITQLEAKIAALTLAGRAPST